MLKKKEELEQTYSKDVIPEVKKLNEKVLPLLQKHLDEQRRKVEQVHRQNFQILLLFLLIFQTYNLHNQQRQSKNSAEELPIWSEDVEDKIRKLIQATTQTL